MLYRDNIGDSIGNILYRDNIRGSIGNILYGDNIGDSIRNRDNIKDYVGNI